MQLSLKRGIPSILKLLRDLLVFDLACSDEHAVFLTREGQVYTWGFGGSGKLGHGGLSDEPLPQIVDTLSKRRCIQVLYLKDGKETRLNLRLSQKWRAGS